MAYDGYTSIDILCENYPDHTFFSASSLEKFHEIGTCITVPKGRMIYRAGDFPEYCYYVENGLIKSFEYDREGNEYIYDLFAQGSLLFGMGIVLEKSRLPLSFKTLSSVDLISIPYSSMLKALKENPDFAIEIFRSISVNYCVSISEIREKSCHSILWQLCNLMLLLSYKFGVEYDNKMLVKETFSQQLLANMLRVSRISIVRSLKELQDVGLVEKINGYYCIRSIEQMKEYMSTLD